MKDSANSGTTDNFEWTPDYEICLFNAMKNHKPVGVSRHFHMVTILENFANLANKEATSKKIWSHLETLYDMEALHENEDLPFPNEEQEFSLPAEFQPLMSEKIAQQESEQAKEEKKTPKKKKDTRHH